MHTVFAFLLFLPLIALAQLDTEYKFLEKKEAVVIGLNKGKLEIYNDIFEQAKFLNNNLLYLAKQSIHFDSFRKIENLEAYTLAPGTGTRIAVDHYEDKDQIQGVFFYSDSKVKEFTFPAVTKDAVTTMSYREVYSEDIPFSQPFVFGSYFPVDNALFTVESPEEVELGYSLFNAEDLQIDFKTEKSKEGIKYTWSASNVKGYPILNDKNESALYYLPHVIVYIKTIKKGNEVKPMLRDVSDLYRWYSTLIKQIDDSDIATVHALADEIAAPFKTQQEKTAAIYNWVQDNISYVAFGDGFGGFVPRGAAGVCQKKYGDCKDMAHVLYVMLNRVGVKAYHTWIGSREKPYSYKQNPTPLVDDHMITAAIINGDTIFLDGTDSFVRFGYPSSFIQAKEALIGISDKEFRVVKVPVMNASKNLTKVNSTIRLQGDDVIVEEMRKLSGYEKTAFMTDYIYKKDRDTQEEYLNKKLKLGNNKTNYDDIKISGLDNDHDQLELSYRLNIQNYSKTIGDKVYLNLDIDRTLADANIDVQNMRFSRKFDHTFTKESVTIFELPVNYIVDALPAPLSHADPNYGFSISYKQEGNRIIMNKKLYINTLSIQPAEFETWNVFIKNLVKAYKKTIVIQKKA